MIKTVLKVKEYCHDCPLFEPKIDRLRFESTDGVTDEVGIRCELEEKCEVLKNFFRKKYIKEDIRMFRGQ